jgi:restriction system protein
MNFPNATISSIMLPTYGDAAKLLSILGGVPRANVTRMLRSIFFSTGTTRQPVNWKKPERWMVNTLEGEELHLAERIWIESGRTINPRYIKGAHLFLNKHELLLSEVGGAYEVSATGNAFLQGDAQTLATIDQLEGILELLSLLQIRGDRKEVLEGWRIFSTNRSVYKADSSVQITFNDRISNVLERGLISKDGAKIKLTAQGRQWINQTGELALHNKERV